MNQQAGQAIPELLEASEYKAERSRLLRYEKFAFPHMVKWGQTGCSRRHWFISVELEPHFKNRTAYREAVTLLGGAPVHRSMMDALVTAYHAIAGKKIRERLTRGKAVAIDGE